jgi:hypothetical protein
MSRIIKALEEYIYEDVGIKISPCIRLQLTSLPYFILDNYDLYRTKVIGKECVLLISKDQQDISPATVKSHVALVREKSYEDVILVHSSISSHNRRRLIEYKIPFVVPGNQMYLPDLLIDLRDYFYSVRMGKNQFSPSTQAAVIYILHNFRAQPFTPSKLAKTLGYSNTAMTRAFNEIETAGIGRIELEGRERWLWFEPDRRMFWDKTLPYLRTPVKRWIWVTELPEVLRKCKAGETALSDYSMLAAPNQMTFAAVKADWESYRDNANIKIVHQTEAAFLLQIWNYDPALFAMHGSVDKFSLYLSLKDNDDERLQSALEEMMESIQW